MILGVANQRIEHALRDAVAAGARSAVTFSSLYEAEPPEPGLPPLAERVAAIARDAGIAVCGGNGMGFLNLETASARDRVRHARRHPQRAGHVHQPLGLGVRGARVQRPRHRVQPDRLVRPGARDDDVPSTWSTRSAWPSTRVIALLIETVRRPGAFRAALAHAADRDVPVVALKVGRTERSKSMVVAHSGALAGEDGAYEALFDAYGVLRVDDARRDGRHDGAVLSAAARHDRPAGSRPIHDSGGERALLVDLAADLDVPFAQISDATTDADPGARSIPGWTRRTRSTRGGPASTPTGSSSSASARCTTIPTRRRSRSWWT